MSASKADGRLPMLAPETEMLVRASAALAARDDDALDGALRRAAEVAEPGAVDEALLQSYLFLGYPVALNGLARWRRLRPPERETTDPATHAEWGVRGARVCRTVYGGQYPALRENVRALHPELDDWMVTEGYGKVLGRPGLSLRTRELCIIAMLVVIETPKQLYSHLRGALNAGADGAEIEAVLALAAEAASAGAVRSAREVWQRVSARAVNVDEEGNAGKGGSREGGDG